MLMEPVKNSQRDLGNQSYRSMHRETSQSGNKHVTPTRKFDYQQEKYHKIQSEQIPVLFTVDDKRVLK